LLIVNCHPMRFIYTKAFAIFAGCLCILAFAVFLQVKGFLDPIRSAALRAPRPVIFLAKSISEPVKNFFATVYQLRKISEENGVLTAKVAGLEQELAQSNQEAVENEALRKELGFVKNANQPLIPCTLLSQNPFGISDSVVLNCGQDDGVEVGQAIISQGYMVGKITYAGKNESTALLAISSDFSTDAKISQTSASAIVKGSFSSGLLVDQVPQTTDLQKGWLVVTAGINDKVPKNILIGEVGDILSTDSDLFKRASLTTPVDYNNLEFVFVVKQ
jgi:rod shape-determining protein MreC